MAAELQVIQDFYDFSLVLLRRVQQFPRHHRYGLGRSLETRTELLLAELIRAKYAARPDRADILKFVNVELEILRFQIRQAVDLKLFPVGGHLALIEGLLNVGNQVGGWRRSLTSGGDDSSRK